MAKTMEQYWWVVLLRGVLGVLFGLLAFFWGGAAFITLVFLFGYYSLCDGCFALWLGVQSRRPGESGWALSLLGLAIIIAGAMAVSWPGPSAKVILTLFAARCLIGSVLEFIAARKTPGWAFKDSPLSLAVIVSAVFGLVFLALPALGAPFPALPLGCFALIYGGALIGYGVKIRSARLQSA